MKNVVSCRHPIWEVSSKFYAYRNGEFTAAAYHERVLNSSPLNSDVKPECPAESGFLLREVFAHDKAGSSLYGDAKVGLISSSRLAYEVKLMDPSSFDLWLQLD